MKPDSHTDASRGCGSITTLEFKRLPSIAWLFSKAILLSFFRSGRPGPDRQIERYRLKTDGVKLDPHIVKTYCRVCGFDRQPAGILPVSFIQPLFIKLLAKYITSSFFPFKPIGLIQVYQSIEWHRPVHENESLDLSCELDKIRKGAKGYLTDFLLTARVADEVVWEGTARYLLKTADHGIKKARPTPPDHETTAPMQEKIDIPADIGRQYAGVSGDYNLHHLYPVFARIFGFKSAIAHGMWSMARCIASLDHQFDTRRKGRVEVAFKLPIFLPAVTALYVDAPDHGTCDRKIVTFELKDYTKKLPHLDGRLYLNK